jgi:hypothetical protein
MGTWEATVWTDGNGNLYVGDCRPGDRAATVDEIAAWEASRSKPPLTFQQWLGLFTPAERAWAFASNDPTVREMIARGAAENAIDLNAPAVAGFLDLCISLGSPLTAQRKAQVLAGQAPT